MELLKLLIKPRIRVGLSVNKLNIMIKYKLINSSQAIYEYNITEIEKLLNIKFPKDLQELYLTFNGGEIEGDKNVYISNSGTEYSIKTFMPIKYKRFTEDQLLEENTIYFINKKLVSNNYLIFSMDWGGFPFCYNLQYGSIYFANLETEESNKRMEFVANSLEEFINGMKTEEEAYN